MSARDLLGAAAGAASKLYVDDVFSTYTYTGTGTTQTINNGIDLAGNGGLVWIKNRVAGRSHQLFDTVRGLTHPLQSDQVYGQSSFVGGLSAASNGFVLNNDDTYEADFNQYGSAHVSWTFRKAPKFFDVVTYTSTGSSQDIPHSLGVQPGLIITKKTSDVSGWAVWHRGANGSSATCTGLSLNTADAAEFASFNTGATINSSTFNTGNVVGSQGLTSMSSSAGTHVAYLFAHDPSADGIIQCGSYVGTGANPGPTINLGWEPQYVLIKVASSTENWYIYDTLRGMPVSGTAKYLTANTPNAEGDTNPIAPTASGFQVLDTGLDTNASNQTYIYLAIRRPNKPPTSGADVFSASVGSGVSSAIDVTTGFPPDVVIGKARNSPQNNEPVWFDRLRGATMRLFSNSPAQEGANPGSLTAFNPNGFTHGGGVSPNASGISYLFYALRRAPGFFDVVCYTGSGTDLIVPHGLGVTPRLIITKCRDSGEEWRADALGVNYRGSLNSSSALNYGPSFSRTELYLQHYASGPSLNGIGNKYVSYLFGSLPGISKVDAYTGNGSSQTIDCGFATGARFILIKRVDSAGDWYVWDTARGIVAANDPHLRLNTTAAEITTDDSVDPHASGFIVNQVAATNVNVSGGTYIYLAIA